MMNSDNLKKQNAIKKSVISARFPEHRVIRLVLFAILGIKNWDFIGFLKFHITMQ